MKKKIIIILLLIIIVLSVAITSIVLINSKKEKDYSITAITTLKDVCLKKGNKCKNGTKIPIKVNEKTGYDFYVINDDGIKITLIISENLGNNVKWTSEDSCNMGPNKSMNYVAELTKEWNNILNRDYIIHDITNCFKDATYNTKARLITYEEISNLGCKHLQNNSCPDYLFYNLENNTSGYWTDSIVSTSMKDSAWVVYKNGGLVQPSVETSTFYGVRPVIEINK